MTRLTKRAKSSSASLRNPPQPFPRLSQQRRATLSDLDLQTSLNVNSIDSKHPNTHHINELIDDVLLLIFEQFPLQQQVVLRLVCRRWAVVLEQICSRKQSLKLFLGPESLQEYLEKVAHLLPTEPVLRLAPAGRFNDDLVLNSAKIVNCNESQLTQFLGRLFPSIKILVFAAQSKFYSSASSSVKFDLTTLLRQWPSLTTVAILNMPASYHRWPREASLPDPLAGAERLEQQCWSAISNLDHLTSLYLLDHVFILDAANNYRDSNCHRKDMSHPAISQTLARLHQFTYGNSNRQFNVHFLLAHLLQVSDLKISLAQCVESYKIFEINENLANLSRNLTSLCLELRFFDFEYLDFICTHFKALRRLHFNVNEEPRRINFRSPNFHSTISQLAKLPHLELLSIIFEAGDLFAYHASFPDPSPLSSLKSLTLLIGCALTPVYFTPNWNSYRLLQYLLPNLEQINVACCRKFLREEAQFCFSKKRFPRLVSSTFCTTGSQLRPDLKQFLGERVSYFG